METRKAQDYRKKAVGKAVDHSPFEQREIEVWLMIYEDCREQAHLRNVAFRTRHTVTGKNIINANIRDANITKESILYGKHIG